jgi:hypothetical protein
MAEKCFDNIVSELLSDDHNQDDDDYRRYLRRKFQVSTNSKLFHVWINLWLLKKIKKILS